MTLKLDENRGQRSQELLSAAGHDVHTVSFWARSRQAIAEHAM